MTFKQSQVLITGGSGFLGSHLVKLLKRKGYKHLIVPQSKDFNLTKAADCRKLTKQSEVVIHLAAKVGGIGYNQNYPADLFHDNLKMGLNMLHESCKAGVKKFVAIGTVCAYPKYTPIPFHEDNLWNGYPEGTNAPYGLAKKMLLVGSQAYRKQHNFNSIFLLPVNLYGPGDNFHPQHSHVIPALIRKIANATKNNQKTVTVWGSGTASREFLYVEDAAQAIFLALELYNKKHPVNIGSGQEIRIADLVSKIATLLNYNGKTIWDKTKPDGQPRRLLNTKRAYREFGFQSTTDLDTGLKKTINWYTSKKH